MVKLQKCRKWYVQHVVKSKWYEEELHRVDALCPLESTERWQLNDMSRANPGHMTFPVGRARFTNRHLSGGGFVEGKKFYRFAQLRSMSDNGNTRRARPAPICIKCNTGQRATLQHTLCQCTDNAATIRKRHDAILAELIAHCRHKKIEVIQEPNLTGGLRPDVIIRKNHDRFLCLDVSVAFELNKESLKLADNEKKRKYEPRSDEMLVLARRKFERGLVPSTTTPSIEVHALVFGARGSIDSKTLNILEKTLGMSKWRIDKILNLVMSFALDLFEHNPMAPKCVFSSTNHL